MNIIQNLNWRYATKLFDNSKLISNENISIIEQSLILTPSSFGLQPWKFIIISDEKVRKDLLQYSFNQSQIIDCSHLVVLCALEKLTTEYIEKYIDRIVQVRGVDRQYLNEYKNMMIGFAQSKSQEDLLIWAKNQCYIALGQMLNIIAEMKIDGCPMEGFNPKGYNEILQLSGSEYTTAVICPIGYRSSEDKYANLKKVRFEYGEVITKV